ncbi:hypothetical protein [Marinobacterium marinum]|uniref:Uncharacterized protein n=1 Tax=Marinobacterium marinum TaxID=2756129 RepID=A0A7W1WX42_9GAMM|nr:hypothetical protein [Marinobacterium marinum]MBA4501843.1 hypothetical protein [Marinobacterium marinum]
MTANNRPYPQPHGHMVELLILEYVRNRHVMDPVTLVDLHKRLSTAFFEDDVRVVIDQMLTDGRLAVEFDPVNVPDYGKHWTSDGRPAVRLKVGEVIR